MLDRVFVSLQGKVFFEFSSEVESQLDGYLNFKVSPSKVNKRPIFESQYFSVLTSFEKNSSKSDVLISSDSLFSSVKYFSLIISLNWIVVSYSLIVRTLL